MKRIICLVLTCAMLFASASVLLSLAVSAAESNNVVESGISRDGHTWELDAGGTLTIRGEGAISASPFGWDAEGDMDAVTALVVEDGITGIDAHAFSYHYGLKNVTLADSVTNIGDYAFYECSSLTNVSLGKGLARIGEYAFYNCRNLADIVIPDGVTFIGYAAFYYCEKLTSVVIPDSVEWIGSRVFSNCSSLTSISIGDGVMAMGSSVFQNCPGVIRVENGVSYVDRWAVAYDSDSSSTEVSLRADTVGIADYVFSGSGNMQSIFIPDSVRSIGWNAFNYCSSLTSIDLPESLQSIEQDVFNECSSLTSVDIPDSVTSIGSRAFAYCTSLTSIHIPDAVLYVGSQAFEGCSGLIQTENGVSYVDNWVVLGDSSLTDVSLRTDTAGIAVEAFRDCYSLTNIALGDQLRAIGDSAFMDCGNLGSIQLPDSVVVIGNSAFQYCHSLSSIQMPAALTSIGAYAFSGCYSLAEVTLGDYVTSIGACAFLDCYSLAEVTLGDHVTSIGTSAFENCYELVSVTIGKHVTNIDDRAFAYCPALESISIPDNVTTMGESVFDGDYALKSIAIGSGVVHISTGTFRNCPNLESITVAEGNPAYRAVNQCLIRTADKTLIKGCRNSVIPSDGSVTHIGDSAFADCDQLTTLVIPDSVTSIGYSAFAGCSKLTSIVIPDSVTTIGESAFERCWGLESVTIGDGLTSISAFAFRECDSLKNVSIGKSLKHIGASAFANCVSLESLVIPDSVTTIGESAFAYCSRLAHVPLGDGVTDIGHRAFEYCYSLEELTLGTGVKNIGSYAFFCCGVKNLTIPDSVTNIGSYAFYNCYNMTDVTIGDGVTHIPTAAFQSCSNLKNVTFGTGVESIGENAFYDCAGLESITIPGHVKSIGSYAFYECTGLTDVTIENGVESIGDAAFAYCTALAHINIPDSVTSIGNSAFAHCTALASITIPKSVTYLGEGVFYGCTGLKSITIPGSVANIGYYAFYGCTGLTDVTIENGVESIGDDAFYGCIGLTSITIPDSVTRIGYYAFYECDSLTDVTIGAGVTEIGEEAFRGCGSLERLTVAAGNTAFRVVQNCLVDIKNKSVRWGGRHSVIPSDGSVTSIADYAFFGCTGLESVTIPACVTTIGDYAFRECTGLKDLTISYGVTSIGYSAFEGCTSLESVTIPASLTSISTGMFANCTSLSDVKIRKGVTVIGSEAFEGCTALERITLPASVTHIYSGAFGNCTSLVEIKIPDSVTYIDWDLFYFNCSDDLIIYCTPGSAVEQFAIEMGYAYEYIVNEVIGIQVTVKDEAGEPVTDGYTVEWYEKGSGAVIATGATLSGAEEDKTYEYRIVLNNTLGTVYLSPARQEVTVYEESPNPLQVTYTLERIPEITVTGQVTDGNGAPLAGVTVIAEQLVNGTHAKTEQVLTDEDGVYSLTLARVDATLRLSVFGYYNKTASLTGLDQQTGTSYDAGTIALNAMPADKITLSLSKTATDGYAQGLTSFYGLRFSLYNVTRNREITAFTAQYPYIVIEDPGVQGGDVIRISVADTQNTMTAAPVEIRLSELKVGQGEIAFVENGKIRVSGLAGADKVVAMLFDQNGRFLSSTPVNGSYTSEALPAGKYQLVLMEKTTLLRGVSSLEKLSSMGLVKDTDYLLRAVTVENGRVTELSGIIVPDFKESKLYYTVDERTGFTTNISTTTLGRFLVLRLEYEIDPRYPSYGQYVTVEMPEGVLFTENSLSFNGSAAPYVKEGNEIKVRTNSASGVIRFYVHADAVGKHNVHAYLGFKSDGEDILQPIGTASFEAAADKVNVPSKTGQTGITVTGTAFAGSTVTVYDNGTPVGTTTANKNGSWSLKMELVKPYTFSYHNIYADISNAKFESDVQSETSTLLYNENNIDLSKITMIYGGSEIVFDFINPSSATPSYSYSDSSFTFKVEFTGGDDTTLSDVYVVTTNDAGEYTYIPVTYDAATGVWLGTHDFTAEDAPIAINAAYEALTDVTISREQINDFVLDVTTEEEDDDSTDYENLIDEEFMSSLENSDISEIESILNELNGDVSVELESYDEIMSGIYGSLGVEFKNVGDNIIFDINGMPYTQQIQNCSGLVKEDLLSNGYEELKTTSNNSIYVKYSEKIYEIVDFESDTHYIIEKTNYEMNMFSLMSSGIHYTKSRRNNDYVIQLRDVIAVAKQSLVEFKDAMNIDVFTATLENRISDYETQLKTKRARLEKTNSIIVHIKANLTDPVTDYNKYLNKAYKLQEELTAQIKHLEPILKNLTRVLKMLRGLPFLGVIQSATDCLEDGEKWIDVWFSIPDKCENDSAAFNEIYSRMKILVGYMIAYYSMTIILGAVETTASVFALGFSIPTGGASLVGYIAAVAALITAQTASNYAFDKYVESELKSIKSAIKDLDCDDDDDGGNDNNNNDNNNNFNQPGQNMGKIIDPSGYVYEAVPSNRVEGVKVECYYYDYPLDEFGMPKEEKEDILWDASEYDQVNPLYTDKDGRYAWDVPPGQWLVKYSKEGYYDTDSRNDRAAVDGYLPVPPPQVDVNTAIVSKAAPTVAHVNVYNKEIQVIFSQYMQPDSVNTSNILFTQNGQAVAGTLTPANAEDNYEGTAQYASIFTFIPDSELEGTVNVEIKNAVNYAGKTMETAYAAQKAVKLKPEAISLPETVDILYGNSVTLPVEILPAEAGNTLTLTVTSSSPSIVAVETATVTTGENGKADIVLKGLLPGQAEITVAIDGTDISVVKTVNVAMQRSMDNRCEKVVANIADGSEIPAGTQIILSTPTEGAEIYYTLDKTCPCIEDSPSRIKYTGPITVTEDVFIIAYAVKEGYEESSTSKFAYTVTAAVCDHTDSTSRPNCEQDAVCSICGVTMPALGHNYASVLTGGETSHYYACSRCNSKKDEADHVFSWIIDKPATDTQDGKRHEECICGATRNENTVIPHTGTAHTPQDQDDSGMIWIVICVVASCGAIAAAVFVIIRVRKKKQI